VRKAFWRALKELFWPAAFALAATWVVARYGDLPPGGWTFILLAGTFYTVFSSAAFFTSQVFTARHQETTEAALTESIRRMQALYDAFDAKGNEIVGKVTGNGSLPCLVGLPDSAGTNDHPKVAVWGNHTQREVVMRIIEAPLDTSISPFLSDSREVGTVLFGHGCRLPPDILDTQKGDHRRLFIRFTALTGTTVQFLHLRRVDGQWYAATRIVNGDINVEWKTPGYPDQPDWIADRDLSGVVLGGKPYNPLP
jgi:hypothetical protein